MKNVNRKYCYKNLKIIETKKKRRKEIGNQVGKIKDENKIEDKIQDKGY